MPILTDLQVLALTIWAEARNQPIEGEIAVANVIKNRAKSGHWGHTFASVCYAPKQFSCWMPTPGDKNYEALMGAVSAVADGKPVPQGFDECLFIANAVAADHFRDNTHGSTHYVTHALFTSDQAPAWVRGQRPIAQIGDHVFFNAIQ